jgi:predicted RNA-binding Zn-ribbon protein involved in translation (DUF1610 family)
MLANNCTPKALRQIEQWAIDRGADFSSSEAVNIPLHLLSHPGVFALTRQHITGFACPSCGSDKFQRHGKPTRTRRPVQQYRCSADRCRSPRFFNEYTDTLLENCSIGAYEWFAIWHWFWECPKQHIPLGTMANTLGLSQRTVQRCITRRLSYRRKSIYGKCSLVRQDPMRLFYMGRDRGHTVSVIDSPDGHLEVTRLVLRIAAKREDPDELQRMLENRDAIRRQWEKLHKELDKPTPTWRHRYLD